MTDTTATTATAATAATAASTSVAPVTVQKKPPPKGLSDIVGMIITVLSVITLVVIFTVFVLSLIDFIMLVWTNMSQQAQISNNIVVLYKDSLDYNLLKYASNNKNNEPYFIFKEQGAVAVAFQILGYTGSVIILYIALLVILYVLSFFLPGVSFDSEDIGKALPWQPLLVSGICLAAAGASMALFKSRFNTVVQPSLKETKGNNRDINSRIYQSMTTNADFLTALSNDDTSRYLQILTENVGSLDCLKKMLYTMSIRDLLTSNIPKSDPTYEQVIKIFDSDNVKEAKIDIVWYLSYGKNNLIQNIFVSNKSIQQALASLGADQIGDLTSALNLDVQTLNRSLTKLKHISYPKTQLISYTFLIFVITTVCMILAALVFSEQIFNIILIVYEKTKTIWEGPTNSTQSNSHRLKTLGVGVMGVAGVGATIASAAVAPLSTAASLAVPAMAEALKMSKPNKSK